VNFFKRLEVFLILSLSLFSLLGLPIVVSAHRSGCHSWHSCPSDSGSYTCGDKGYCSGCPSNQYCKNGSYSPTPTPAPKKSAPTPTTTSVITGAPKTVAELYKCLVVANKKTKIYHLKGSSYIRQMSVKDKDCFASEKNAKERGYRKALR
jgi:hypothetical protein